MIVVDASLVVAALTVDGDVGDWARSELLCDGLHAPHLMPIEAANVLRRGVLAGRLTEEVAGLAHAELVDLPIVGFPYAPIASRVWELRGNLTAYDAAYVALAELLDMPLVTLDSRLARAPGVECVVRSPDARPGTDS